MGENTYFTAPEEGGKQSFAEKLKINPDLQVAVFSEPLKLFTENDKLDFVDAVGNILFELPEGDEMPEFISTVRKDRYIIITASDEKSKEWLEQIIPNLTLLNLKWSTMPANEIPKMKKGLLWLPGRQKFSNEDIVKRIAKQNPDLNPTNWRIFSRHEEDHGVRLLLGVTENAMEAMGKKENKPQWSTVRAQFTPIEEVIQRKKDRIRVKHGKSGKERPTNEERKETVLNPERAAKRKPEGDVSLTETGTGSPVVDMAIKEDYEKGLLGDRDDPFTPTRSLPRSPSATKSMQRPTKKQKWLNPGQSQKIENTLGKITNFFTPLGGPLL